MDDRDEPRGTTLETWLSGLVARELGVARISLEHNFFDRGGTSLQAARCVQAMRHRLGAPVYVSAFYDAATLADVASWLRQHLPDAVAEAFGEPTPSPPPCEVVDDTLLARFKAALSQPVFSTPRRVLHRVVFVLSAPRSGSTLLRAMLAGHPRLFAPPELDLLPFDTLRDRRQALDRHRHALDGSVVALMRLRGVDVEQARTLMTRADHEGSDTAALYTGLCAAAAPRLLVDKSPAYALYPAALQQAERMFQEPVYIHLVRHPQAMIRSFEETRLDQIFWPVADAARQLGVSTRTLAELVWRTTEANLLRFLDGVPAGRQCLVRFEELVAHPREALAPVCERLEIPFDERLLHPYDDPSTRMTGGLHDDPASRMQGDPRFHEHDGIDPSVLARPRADAVSEGTAALARRVGYPPDGAPP